MRVRSLGWKIPWRRAQKPTQVFLPGKPHGQRSQVGYSPWGCKELDMMEHKCMHACIFEIRTHILNYFYKFISNTEIF